MILTSIAALADGSDPAPAPDYDTPLVVSGLEQGDVANFYKIVEWVGDATQPAGSVVVSGWKVLAPYDTVLTKTVFEAAFVGTPDDPATENANEAVAPTGITSAIAGELAKKISANGAAAPTEVSVVANTPGTDYKAVLENNAPGMWMVLVTPNDPDTLYNPVFVGSDYNTTNSGDIDASTATYQADAVAKKSTVTLTKTADTTEDTWDNPTTAHEGNVHEYRWSTTAIGDTVSYTVNTTIPGYGEVYTNPVFKVVDQLTNLTLKPDTNKTPAYDITVDPATYTVGETTKPTYSSIVVDEGAAKYTITFDPDYLKTLKVPTAVTITYKAIVTDDAPLSVNKEKNEVSTEFSHNPSNENDHGFKKDTTNHYTFPLDADILGRKDSEKGKKTSELVKVGLNADGTYITAETQTSWITGSEHWEGSLAGATFGLFTNAAGTEPYVPNGASAGLTATTTSDGRMQFPGLDAGTYYLKEIEAPTGFVRDTTVYMIKIEALTKTVEITEYTTDGVTWISQAAYDNLGAEEKKAYKSFTYDTDVLNTYTVKVGTDADHLEATATYHFVNEGNDVEVEWTEDPPVEHPFDIQNTKGVELPSTGGIGTTIFYIAGSLLVLAAAILLITKRRMSSND